MMREMVGGAEMADEITNTQNFIDSRDIDKRIEELEADQDIDVYDQEELTKLLALRDNVSSSEWSFGLALINVDDFEEHAEQMAEDIGAIDPNAEWPLSYIDWEAAANALKSDYTTVEFDGQKYLYRE